MNRSQLVEELASTTGLTKRQAEEAVDVLRQSQSVTKSGAGTR